MIYVGTFILGFGFGMWATGIAFWHHLSRGPGKRKG